VNQPSGTQRGNVSTGIAYYYFEDILSSSIVVVTSSGGPQNESDCYPFSGECVVTRILTNQKFKFTGKERDPESGLDDFGARYYNSNMGRFQSLNWANKGNNILRKTATCSERKSRHLFRIGQTTRFSLVWIVLSQSIRVKKEAASCSLPRFPASLIGSTRTVFMNQYAERVT
jgi:RHS repeat-associated protein